jgi:hypothetical protein
LIPHIIRKGKVMRALSFALLLMASMAFVLLGCSENASLPVAPTDRALSTVTSPAVLAKGGTVLHTASGVARVREFWGEAVKFEFSFSAVQHDGGTSSGEVQMVDHAGLKFHGKIFSLQVEGNRAKLNWTFTSGPWTGLYGCAVVEDNGEGGKAAPDMTTSVLWTDGSDIGIYTIPQLIEMSPNEFIDWLEDYVFVELIGLPPGLPALIPTEHGNVQVK